jgi:hypothetical protein
VGEFSTCSVLSVRGFQDCSQLLVFSVTQILVEYQRGHTRWELLQDLLPLLQEFIGIFDGATFFDNLLQLRCNIGLFGIFELWGCAFFFAFLVQ